MFRSMMIFSVASMSAALPVYAQDVLEDSAKTLEQKLLGAWKGYGPCDGRLILHANGTYERQSVGPAGVGHSGNWSLKWNALPPTLRLDCKSADVEEIEGTSISSQVVRLDDTRLDIQFEGYSEPIEFSRIQK